MKIKTIVCCLIILSMNVHSRENGANMLKNGSVEVKNYIITTVNSPEGVDQIDYIQLMKISMRENNFYEIEINFNHNNKSEYWYFKIINIENTGKNIIGQLVEISIVDTSGMWHIDDKATGKIMIALEENIITVEILFHTHNSESNNKIIWKNNIRDN